MFLFIIIFLKNKFKKLTYLFCTEKIYSIRTAARPHDQVKLKRTGFLNLLWVS
jgi:hypothetical protein